MEAQTRSSTRLPIAQPLQASLSSSARYSASGLLTSQQTTVLYRLEPIGEIDHAEYLNLVVAADQFGGLYPDLEIYDSSGDRIPTRVLHYSSGVLVVQAKDVEPNHPYYIAITPASTAAAHQVGGFEFIGEFGSTRLDPTSIGIFSLNAQKPVLELPITLQTSRLVHVLIDSLDTESARPDEAIWATIVDEQGSILAQLGMNQGQSRSFPIVFLEPGDYRIIVQSGRVDHGPIRLQRLRISVDEISVDIGPGVMNPILQPVVPGNSQVPTPTRPANPPIVINAPLYPNPTVLPQNPIYPSIAPFGTPSWFFWPTMESQITSTSHPARQIALDVSKDTMVTPRDALLILNYLNAPTEVPDQDYDCNGDGFVTPLDALLILNFLNARISAEGEQVDPVGVERISFAPCVAMAPSDGGAETMDAKRRKGQG